MHQAMNQEGQAMVNAVEVDGLHVERGKKEVLHGISAQIPAGSVTGLLGPSGSGKTTLMRSIVGVQVVRSGRVTVLGEPAGSVSLRRKIGYVTQSPSVYPDLTVAENVGYFGNRYDRLILIREGAIVADDTPAAVKAAVGTDDLDEAFLRLVTAAEVA